MDFLPNFKIHASPTDPNQINCTYVNTHVTHPDLSDVNPGDDDVVILRIGVETMGLLNPLALNSMTFGAKGADASKVSGAKIYYTGDDDVFNNSDLLQTLTAPVNDE